MVGHRARPQLSQFVHTGTYLLIFSILVASSFVALLEQPEFFSAQRPLKNGCHHLVGPKTCYWPCRWAREITTILPVTEQPTERIGVLVFLLLTVIGLISLYLKVRRTRKSMFYLCLPTPGPGTLCGCCAPRSTGMC